MSFRYVFRRLIQAALSAGAIVVVTFFVFYRAGVDPVQTVGGPDLNPADQARLREELGLERPLLEQFTDYAARLVRGDLGRSYVSNQSVVDEIGEYLPSTLLLMATATAISSVGGIALGTFSAKRPFGLVDLSVNFATLIAYAVPVFWVAQGAQLTLAVEHQVFPLLGMTDPHVLPSGLDRHIDVAYHLVLPAAVLAASELALVTRITRSGLLHELGEDYARAASAQGLPRSVVVARARRNALLPVVTVIGSRIGFLFSGAVVVEYAFVWPGTGSLLIRAVHAGDRPLVLGIVLLIALTVMLANLVTDLIYAWIDPRVRLT